MVTPQDILKKALTKYVTFLTYEFNNSKEKFFPLDIPCDKKLNFNNLKELERGITLLQSYSTDKKEYGYTVRYEEKYLKQFGKQNVPVRISFISEEDYLYFIDRYNDTKLLRSLILPMISEFPEVKSILIKNYRLVLKNHLDWSSIIKVCRFFKANPQTHKFVRELNIGVHTKFVENHKEILRPLLDTIIGPDLVNNESPSFYGHFNLKEGDPFISFRVLDEHLAQEFFSGLSYNTVHICEFAKLKIPIHRVIIVENKCNMIDLLPSMPSTLVIWGSGYKVTVLKDVEWLEHVQIFYWGDIDVQGFEILSNIRKYFPQIKSIMMDGTTVAMHPVPVQGVPSTVCTDLYLNEDEEKVYHEVKENQMRYEQEILPQDYIFECLNKL